ncbi:MAG: YfhO family protein [Fibromonadaceae bacterium]|nr:YfhO family protein [Fibromonadaceae bacterium]
MKKNQVLAIAALAFLALLLIVFNGFVFDSSKLMLTSDALNGLGSYYMRAENLILPEWDASRLGGVPTLDAVAGSAYHPLALLRFVMDPGRAEGWIFIFVIWTAFISAFILGSYLTDKWQWGALLGYLYAFSPQYFTFVYGGHEGKMMVFGIAPFAMYALLRLLREGSLKHLIYLSLSIIWMVTSAHIQLTYFFLWGAGLFVLFELFSNKLSVKIRGIRLGLAALALAIGLMISAFQVIPPYLYTTTESVRGSAEKTTIEHSASWSLHGEELSAMILPGFLGTDAGNEKNTYWGQNHFKLNADCAGTLLTFLALCGCLLPSNRKQALFWFSGCVIALSYAVGLHSFLFSVWFNIIPGVKNFRAPSMAIFWLPLAFVFLAAPVLKNFEENKKIIKQGAILYGALLVAVLIFRYAWESLNGVPVAIFVLLFGGYFIKLSEPIVKRKSGSSILDFSFSSHYLGNGQFTVEHHHHPHYNPSPVNNKLLILRVVLWAVPFLILASFFLSPVDNGYFKSVNFAKAGELASFSINSFVICGIVLGTAFFVLSNEKMDIAKKAMILAAVAALDLAAVNLPYIQNVPASQYYNPNHPIIQAIKKDSPNNSERSRIFSLTRNPAISGNNLAAYGFRNALGFHDNEIATYRVFKEQLQNQAMIDIMNVGYIIFDGDRGTGFQPNPGDLGRAKLYYNFESMENQAIIQKLKDNDFDYRNILLLEGTDKAEGLGQGKVKITSAKMDNIIFEVESSSAGKLFISENYHKYWKAKVNGENTGIRRAFSTFMALDVPQGKSIVELRYSSDNVKISLWIGLAGLLLLLGVVLVLRFLP